MDIHSSDILLLHVVGNGVYKAVWNNEVIAVKIYPSIPQNSVTNEIEIWKKLKNPNILEFMSRGTMMGENEDAKVEFVISPFFPHGNLCSYLRQMQWNYHGMPRWPSRFDERRIFFDTAKGMKYLHSERILHGNLKVRWFFFKKAVGTGSRSHLGFKCSYR